MFQARSCAPYRLLWADGRKKNLNGMEGNDFKQHFAMWSNGSEEGFGASQC
jgi:hypothetical protein